MSKNHHGNKQYGTNDPERLLKDRVLSLCRNYFNNNDIAENINLFDCISDRDGVYNFVSFLNGKINTNISLRRRISVLSVNNIVGLIEEELIKIQVGGHKIGIKPVFKDRYVLSYTQRRSWVLYKLNPNSAFCNISFTHKITGPLNLGVFKETIRALVGRHDSLRANFRQDKNGPVQTVAAKFDFDKIVRVIDLPRAEGEDKKKERVELIIKKQTQAPFKLETDSLLRIVLIKI